MEISTKKISHMGFSFETQLRLSFLPPFTGGKKCLEFPLGQSMNQVKMNQVKFLKAAFHKFYLVHS